MLGDVEQHAFRPKELLLEIAGLVPVLALIVDEAVVQDGYMNALTDGYGQP